MATATAVQTTRTHSIAQYDPSLLLGKLERHQSGVMGEGELEEFWLELVRTGIVWKMPHPYPDTAMRLVEMGKMPGEN